METNNKWYKTEEEAKLAEKLINMEKEALEKWFNGDTSGYLKLWSKRSFTYFDAVHGDRVDSHEEITDYVLQRVEGKLKGYGYEMRSPRVQFGVDIAVLTYQIFQKTNFIDINYNCIEVFQKEDDDWHVIQSTWSIIRPMDMDFGPLKEVV